MPLPAFCDLRRGGGLISLRVETRGFFGCSLAFIGLTLLDSSFVLRLGVGESFGLAFEADMSFVAAPLSVDWLVRRFFLGGCSSDSLDVLERALVPFGTVGSPSCAFFSS